MKTATKSRAAAPSAASCDECLCQGAGPMLTSFLRTLGPSSAAKKHFDQSRVEFLRGLRALLDARIDAMSKSQSHGAKINVE